MILFGKDLSKSPPLFIAEISCNHNGSLDEAKEIIHAAKEAGADAVKIQCYSADEMTFDNLAGNVEQIQNKDFTIKDGPWKDRNLYTLYMGTATPHDWIPELFSYAYKIDVPLFSSVFGTEGLNILQASECPAYKIASFEFNDIPLIEKVTETNKPLLLSTGMASPDEIVRVANMVDRNNTCFMHCVSKYPHYLDEAQLFKLNFLSGFYPITIGYSDHCKDVRAMHSAIILGAKIIETHFTIREDTEDKDFSHTPLMYRGYKHLGLEAWEAMQSRPHAEDESRQFRRSLYIVKNVKKGELFTLENVKSIRPSYGLEPWRYKRILGKKASKDLEAGTALKMEYVEQ